ncbi:flagellar biosynthetic protein FliO [Bradyrhizobium sp. WD16]|uniref:flagellar biosynthetic protein FliO n=1 Tax=Bradyrhizobium sp. WD16 TaxID=1521768 RepID=UPI0020A39973|nr:flagellar biosynthetic protein FliO [Bradyrhizobium sp. WD16]UTD28064.1 hypothetical protein DB459_15370 [Bradyrhizobium sp. WD16]
MQVQLAFVLMVALVLGLVGLAFWLIREFAAERRVQTRDATRRISVVEFAAIKGGRQLVLVRYRETEHLLLIGGAADVVVESRIAPPPARFEAEARPFAIRDEEGAAAPSADVVPYAPTLQRPAAPTLPWDLPEMSAAPRDPAFEPLELRRRFMAEAGARTEDHRAPMMSSGDMERLAELEDQIADLLNGSRPQVSGLRTPGQEGRGGQEGVPAPHSSRFDRT